MVYQPPAFSPLIFLTMVVICAASLATFLLLVRRWTTQRQWVSLAEWSKDHDFGFRKMDADFPAVLSPLREVGAQARLHICSDNGAISLMQLQTAPAAGKSEPNVWNLLVRTTPRRHDYAAGLRPANAPGSVLDLMGLSQFPSVSVGQRFAVLATTSSAASAVAESASRTLLPADIGLLLAQEWLLLDFSGRPFDPIELDRMIALAQQLSEML